MLGKWLEILLEKVLHAREGTPKGTAAVGDPCWGMIPSEQLWPWATHTRARTTLRDCIFCNSFPPCFLCNLLCFYLSSYLAVWINNQQLLLKSNELYSIKFLKQRLLWIWPPLLYHQLKQCSSPGSLDSNLGSAAPTPKSSPRKQHNRGSKAVVSLKRVTKQQLPTLQPTRPLGTFRWELLCSELISVCYYS